MTFITSPNQRRVTIHKSDCKKNYSKIDIRTNKEAMQKLGYSAYMLYMVFCMNANGFEVIPSRVAICNATSLSKNVYYAAFDKLVKEGYLVQRQGTQCLYDFYESPVRLAQDDPKIGKAYAENRESTSLKPVENIKNNMENTDRGRAYAHHTGEEKKTVTANRTRKKLFVDM